MPELLSNILLYLIASPIIGIMIFFMTLVKPALLFSHDFFFLYLYILFFTSMLILLWSWKKKSKDLFLRLSIGIAFWQYGSFLSNLLSFQRFEEAEAIRFWTLSGSSEQFPSIGSAGFPFRSHELPPYVLGGGSPPKEMWLEIFLNHGFWLIVALIGGGLFVNYLNKQKVQPSKIKLIIYLSLFVSFLGFFSSLGYYLLAFD